jgi:hypothetical protein
LKKPIAVSLLVIYLFSISGHLALHQYLNYLSDQFFTEQTSKGLYNTGDLTEVKLPANMPDIADWKSYENISGRIDFEDISYNYVKMKITRTAIYLMCVPDYKTTKLCSQNVINARHTQSPSIPKKNHVPYGKIAISGQFSCAFTQFAFYSFAKSLPPVIVHPSARLASQYGDIPRQPPKFPC